MSVVKIVDEQDELDVKLENILTCPNAVKIVIDSIRDHHQQTGRYERLQTYTSLAHQDIGYDQKSIELLEAVADTGKLEVYGVQAIDFLNYLKIDIRQLEFIERFLELDGIAVDAVLPEGIRAFVPLAACIGTVPDFNRVYIFTNVPAEHNSLERQITYFNHKVGKRPDNFIMLDDFNYYFSYDGVGRNNLANAYIITQLKP